MTQSLEIQRYYPELAQRLRERRDEILGRVQVEREHLGEQVMSAPGDAADESVIDTSADYFVRLNNQHQRELLEIRDALERIHRGSYGVCQSCEETIVVDRLRNLPFASLCVDCQAARERSVRLRSA
jgi:DnaK suppressor protein